MICESCGKDIPKNTAKCPSCGAVAARLATKSDLHEKPLFSADNLKAAAYWTAILVAALFGWLSLREFMVDAHGTVVRKEIENVPRYDTRGQENDDLITRLHVENGANGAVENFPQYYPYAENGDSLSKKRFSFAIYVNGQKVARSTTESLKQYIPLAGLALLIGLGFFSRSRRNKNDATTDGHR